MLNPIVDGTRFSFSDYQRYSRQLILSEVKVEGQKRLKESRVICIGAGGLASSLLMNLAAVGVGNIGIIDNDYVDISNLQRQIIHNMEYLDRNKAFSAKNQLLLLNPNCKVLVYPKKLTTLNALNIIKDYDIVVDCTDNFNTRFLIDETILILNKTLVHGAIFKFEGQISVLNYQGGPAYRDIQTIKTNDIVRDTDCKILGVIGVLPNIIGTIQATEVIKIILGLGNTLSGRILMYNALSMEFREIRLRNLSAKKINYIQSFSQYTSQLEQDSYRLFSLDELKFFTRIYKRVYLIIDVRNYEDYNQEDNLLCHHIPLMDINKKILLIKNLVKGKYPILRCNNMQKSIIAHKILKKNGINSAILKTKS